MKIRIGPNSNRINCVLLKPDGINDIISATEISIAKNTLKSLPKDLIIPKDYFLEGVGTSRPGYFIQQRPWNVNYINLVYIKPNPDSIELPSRSKEVSFFPREPCINFLLDRKIGGEFIDVKYSIYIRKLQNGGKK